MGRRKSHHTHEVTDAYAEGWDARAAWKPGQPEPPNPYEAPIAPPTRKQTFERETARGRDALLWREGWDDCGVDGVRNDLDEIKASDFRRAPKVGAEPVDSEGDEDEIDDQSTL